MDQAIKTKLDLFFQNYKPIRYKAKEVILRADEDIPPFVYFLLSGYIKQYAISSRGEEILLNIFKPYSCIPLVHVLSEIPNHCYFETIVSSQIIKVPKQDLILFLKTNNDILYDFSKRLSRGLDTLLTNIESLLSGHAQNKVLMALVAFNRRFGENVNGHRVIQFSLTHKHIASFVGLSRETVSREMERLTKKGIIEKKKGLLYIKNMKGLMEALLLQ
ncbi:MAG: Crp/Fnr family transcriptional regulator [Patescibacteria group bacterium]